ncbi:hypothetical protein GCM10029964_035710 [Kibdelosporangium lantanae]
MPSDVVGVQIFDNNKGEFQFKEGPVFANIVLGDEINRASPKTQSALLEAMGERQVTVDGVTYALPRPNFVIATQNPVDQQGTYTLPEAQLDRFMMLLRIGYPSPNTRCGSSATPSPAGSPSSSSRSPRSRTCSR